MKKTVTLKNIYGQTVTAFDGDYITQKILRHGIYEGSLLRYLGSLLLKMAKPVVFDVGANIGNHTLSFARHADRVYSFEPIPDIFSVLNQNIHQNNLSNVTAINCALSDSQGNADIFIIADNVGASSLEQRTSETNTITVSKKCGDDVIRELALDKLDLIKIDVEGHEIFALQGLMESIKKFQPIIVMEWNDPVSIARINKAGIFSSLFSGYEIFVLGTNFDREYWQGKKLSALRRRLALLFSAKHTRLYGFDSSMAYHNILLVPKTKLSLLSGASYGHC